MDKSFSRKVTQSPTSPQTLIEIRVILTFGEQMSLYKNIYMVSLLQMSFQIEKE